MFDRRIQKWKNSLFTHVCVIFYQYWNKHHANETVRLIFSWQHARHNVSRFRSSQLDHVGLTKIHAARFVTGILLTVHLWLVRLPGRSLSAKRRAGSFAPSSWDVRFEGTVFTVNSLAPRDILINDGCRLATQFRNKRLVCIHRAGGSCSTPLLHGYIRAIDSI